jgi:ParB-like chromosome segregation protein Spo0J
VLALYLNQMKIRVKDIEFNPFRNLSLVPIDKVSVDKIKESIETTGRFWSGMEARPKDNDWSCSKYQIPFGHHRLVAITELGYKEIDLPISEISDSNMVLMMVKENMTQRGLTTEMINGTVEEVKNYLDSELAKYKTWEEAKKSHLINLLGVENDERTYQSIKSRGVGQTTILKFLGKSIEQYKIQAALDNIKANDIDREATAIFEKINVSREFNTAIRSINKDNKKRGKPAIKKEDQKELAKRVKKRIDKTGNKGISSGGGSTYRKSLKNIILQELGGTDEYEIELNEIMNEITVIESDLSKLSKRIISLNGKLSDLGIENIQDISSVFIMDSFTDLFSSASKLVEYFGFKFENIKIEEEAK